jgi:hypothetical protein
MTRRQSDTSTSCTRNASLCASMPAGAGRPGRAAGLSPGRVERRAGAKSALEEPPYPDGLVPCAITVRDHEEVPGWSPDGLWQPAFPGPELVGAAADLLPSVQQPSGRTATLSEGPRWEVVISPGVIRVRTRDYARAERTSERRGAHHQAAVDMAATFLAGGEDIPELLPTRGTIVAWSPKSRARLVARLSDLDYTRLILVGLLGGVGDLSPGPPAWRPILQTARDEGKCISLVLASSRRFVCHNKIL